ncbi:MAG: hypothetical protein LBG43_08825 [Treponema sp.]|jgi:hypothetical protein|nr:hypothetical protein [Treponema sp.]
MKKSFFITITLMMALTLMTALFHNGLFADGEKDSPSAGIEKPGRIMRIIGAVKVFGNEPHTFAGIVTADGKRYGVSPREKEAALRRLQGRTVEFTARLLEKPEENAALFLKDGTVEPLSWRIVDD